MDGPCQVARLTDGMSSVKPAHKIECERNCAGSTTTLRYVSIFNFYLTSHQTCILFFCSQDGREFLPTTSSLAFIRLPTRALPPIHPYSPRILDLLHQSQAHLLGLIPVLVYQKHERLPQSSMIFQSPCSIRPTLWSFWTS